MADLQRIFSEDWDFASGERLEDHKYYQPTPSEGPYPVQIIDSGPDRELKSIRERLHQNKNNFWPFLTATANGRHPSASAFLYEERRGKW